MTPTTVQGATTERARALVADRKAEAAALGREAGDLIHDPATLVATLPGSGERGRSLNQNV